MRKRNKATKGNLLEIGAISFLVLILLLFIVVAIFLADKSSDYVGGEGVVVEYKESMDSDDNTVIYRPVVEYEYEGVKYTEVSASGWSMKTYEIGEKVNIMINPIDPSNFSLESDKAFVWVIIWFVAMVIYIVICFTLISPKLKVKYSIYNWDGIFGSSIFILFSLGLFFAIYTFQNADNIITFIKDMPFAIVFIVFFCLGLLGFMYETIRALRLKILKDRDRKKFYELFEKEKNVFPKLIK